MMPLVCTLPCDAGHDPVGAPVLGGEEVAGGRVVLVGGRVVVAAVVVGVEPPVPYVSTSAMRGALDALVI